MILLFGDKAAKSASSNKSSNVKNHPVENSGILAMNMSDARSLLSMGEYDTYVTSSPVAVDYSMYSDNSDYSYDSGFMSNFSAAVSYLGDSAGVSAGSYSSGAASYSGASCGSSCGSFASVC